MPSFILLPAAFGSPSCVLWFGAERSISLCWLTFVMEGCHCAISPLVPFNQSGHWVCVIVVPSVPKH